MTAADTRVASVRVDQIQFHAHNVRRDLGDLRPLAASIKQFGVMQPVVVENWGDHLRLRAGHRRVAAARLAGLRRIPAIVHGRIIATDEWLVHAVQENVMRRDLDAAGRAATVDAMRREGMTWEAIADAFGVAPATARGYATSRSGPTTATDAVDERRDQIRQATEAGESASLTASRLGVTPRTVHRHRTGTHPQKRYQVTTAQLRRVVDAWRAETDHRDVTTGEVLDALTALAATADPDDAMPTTPAERAADEPTDARGAEEVAS